jgi:hypothetical protein
MTVASSTATATLNWTGVETGFSPGFQAMQASDVTVTYVVGAIQLQLVAGTHYSIALDGSGFVQIAPLALPPPPAAPATSQLVIARNTSPLQAVSFADGVPPSAEALEQVADAGAMRDQELRRDVNGFATAAFAAIVASGGFQTLYADWLASLPTAAPASHGVFWNDAGVAVLS